MYEDTTGKRVFHMLTPTELRKNIFEQLHEHRIAGHLGRDRTLHAVQKRFYWVGMKRDISRWCRECSMCVRSKPGPSLSKNPLQLIRTYQPMSVLALDIMGPLPRTGNDN